MIRSQFRYLWQLFKSFFHYHNGLTKPFVWWGYFYGDENGRLQKNFFKLLLKSGYRRTPFQLVMPGQTAGLIKKYDNGRRQFHIRFFADGAIDCEDEVAGLRTSHFIGEKYRGLEPFKKIMEQCRIAKKYQEKLLEMLQNRDFFLPF